MQDSKKKKRDYSINSHSRQQSPCTRFEQHTYNEPVKRLHNLNVFELACEESMGAFYDAVTISTRMQHFLFFFSSFFFNKVTVIIITSRMHAHRSCAPTALSTHTYYTRGERVSLKACRQTYSIDA